MALIQSPGSAWLTLEVNGVDISFLCDSGACRTVITKKDATFPYEKGQEKIKIRSASGELETQCVTEPLKFCYRNEETVEAQVVISITCPVNLLGRDVLTKLKLGVIPMGSDRWEAVKITYKQDLDENLVIQERGEPQYYYALQLKEGPGQFRQELLKLAYQRVMKQSDFQTPKNLHCTMWYRDEGGSSQPYEKHFKLGSSTRLTIQCVYWNAHNMGGKAILQPLDAQLHQGLGNPHVSIAKGRQQSWHQVGDLVDQGTKVQDWRETEEKGIWYSPRTGLYSQCLNWVYQCERTRKMHSGKINP